MTRINLIKAKMLMDQHLIAEIKEINQLAGSFRVSLKSKNGIDVTKLPKNFKLNTGHVKFFYNKGKYLENRFNDLVAEAKERKYIINAKFNNEWFKNSRLDLYQDWEPNENDISIVTERINFRISQKPTFYTYYRKHLST